MGLVELLGARAVAEGVRVPGVGPGAVAAQAAGHLARAVKVPVRAQGHLHVVAAPEAVLEHGLDPPGGRGGRAGHAAVLQRKGELGLVRALGPEAGDAAGNGLGRGRHHAGPGRGAGGQEQDEGQRAQQRLAAREALDGSDHRFASMREMGSPRPGPLGVAAARY